MTWQATGPFDRELQARDAAQRWSNPTAGLDEPAAYEIAHQQDFWHAGPRDARKQRLWEAFQRTGIQTGRYDNELAVWIAEWGVASVEVVASLIERAYEAGARNERGASSIP